MSAKLVVKKTVAEQFMSDFSVVCYSFTSGFKYKTKYGQFPNRSVASTNSKPSSNNCCIRALSVHLFDVYLRQPAPTLASSFSHQIQRTAGWVGPLIPTHPHSSPLIPTHPHPAVPHPLPCPQLRQTTLSTHTVLPSCVPPSPPTDTSQKAAERNAQQIHSTNRTATT